VAGRAARRALLHDASALPRDGPRAAGIVRRVAADGHHRYQSSLYRKPSPYLVSRMRRYEALHRKCGPGTLAYNRSLAQLAASAHSLGVVECSYLVWTPSAGRNNLGDSMLSMASAFLYALLTGRVLLAHVADDMAGLFCEPSPARRGSCRAWASP
jgi:hypothetical protein